jgi:hypothetical protein
MLCGNAFFHLQPSTFHLQFFPDGKVFQRYNHIV